MRGHLVPDLAGQMNDGTKDVIMSAVMNVLFQWCLFGAGLDVLGMIVKPSQPGVFQLQAHV